VAELSFDLISDALPFGRLRHTKLDDAIEYVKFRSRSHPAVIRVYDDAGNFRAVVAALLTWSAMISQYFTRDFILAYEKLLASGCCLLSPFLN